MSKKNKNNSIFVAVLVLVFAAYTIACGYLFYMQAARAEGQYFESDLPAHLSMAKDGWGYSLTAVFYRLFMLLPGFEIFVAAFLALFAGGTMAATYFGIRKFIGNRWSALGASVAANIVMPCFMKAVHYERYIGYQSPSVWHNSTYTVMKCLALLTLIFYLRFAHGYKKKIQWRDWILFASAIIPSIAVVLLQEAVLFGGETGNGIVIDFGYNVYLRAQRPYFTMILSALFPVLIFLFNIGNVIRETLSDLKKKYFPRHTPFVLAWSMWAIGALELLFLKETGKRELDGNFLWGYDFCLFVLFVVSIVYFMNNLRSVRFLKGSYAGHIAYASVLGAVLAYHMYCGLYFFLRLLGGTTYFMQG